MIAGLSLKEWRFFNDLLAKSNQAQHQVMLQRLVKIVNRDNQIAAGIKVKET
jgi:hypothetical protein